MLKFICLFLPALLAMWLYEHLSKNRLQPKSWAYRYALDVLLINGICFAVKHYILHTATAPLTDLGGDMLPSAALNYLIMSIPLAVIIGVIQVFCAKHTTLTAEDAPNET